VFYSPENKPTELHISKMIQKIHAKGCRGSQDSVTQDDLLSAASFLNENIWFLKPEKDFTIDTMLDRIRQLKDKRGIDYFVIDAWNKLEHKYTDSETKYIGESLDKISVFCEAENIHAFIVVHPTKMRRQKDSMAYEIPTLYDCAGSANWFNKSDNGITIYRHFENDNKQTDVIRTKVKFTHWGTTGVSSYFYDTISGRYYFNEINKHELWIK
jgi:twinkle protein